MTPDQIHKTINDFIDRQGLKFQPLRTEMLDHLISDVENRMQNGCTFNKAWEEVKSEIPINHFRDIQQQTMETIDNRFRISRIFTNLFISLIILGSLFKFMHLPGAGVFLMGSFGSIAIALIVGAMSGIYINKTRKGSMWVIAMILGILLLLFAFSFRVFHLPGVELLAVLAVAVLLVSSVAVTLTISQGSSDGESLLTFLHEKYTPRIQRALFAVLGVGFLFKIIASAKGADYFVGDLVLILLIYGAGINLLLLFWRYIEAQNSQVSIRLIVILSIICLFLPVLNFYLPFLPRMVMAALFYLSAGYLVYRYLAPETNKFLAVLCLVFNFIHFACWVLVEMEVLSAEFNQIIYNLPVAFIFLIPFWLFRKDKMMLAFWIVAVASFMLQFSS